MKHEKLYVLSVISNPQRYQTRYRLYREFAAYMESHANIVFYTVETAYGDRPHEVTSSDNPFHIQLRSNQELWHKENMLNIAMAHLPPEAQYIAWIDADVKFMRYDWVEETIHKLQHHPIVQMFSHATLLNAKQHPDHNAISFAYAYQLSHQSFDPKVPSVPLRFGGYGGTPYKTGLAWAFTRDALIETGGMMDTCIIGSADYHMAASYIGRAKETIPPGANAAYTKMILDWEKIAFPVIKGNIGYVDGTLIHFWHGEMKDRRYGERWAIIEHFDPTLDLIRDWTNQGLLKLVDHGPRTQRIERNLREYFSLRNEDSI